MYIRAQKDGIIAGSFFTLSFLCFLAALHAPALTFVWMATMLFAPFLVGKRVVAYRKTACKGVITYLQAFRYSFLVFIFGSLILAFLQWLYFQYIDQGGFVSHYIELLTNPENQKVLEVYQLQKEDIDFMVENISALRPIDFALHFLFFNILIGCLISLIIAATVKKS